MLTARLANNTIPQHKMIRPCTDSDVPNILAIVNDAAQAYKGVIPPDRWHEPYMPLAELKEEIAAGVKFWGCEEDGQLIGVMGMQPVKDVTLIRHAYVRTGMRNRGIGGRCWHICWGRRTEKFLSALGRPPAGPSHFTGSTGSNWSATRKRTGCSKRIGTFPGGRLKRRWFSFTKSQRKLTSVAAGVSRLNIY